jgi:hypothetical protein
MANKEAVEFALTTLIAWMTDAGHKEIGGIISRNGIDYQFELKEMEGDNGKTILPSQEP